MTEHPTPLAAWLAANKITTARFAEMTQTAQSTIWNAQAGKKRPSLATAVRIEFVTKGEVMAWELADPEDIAKARELAAIRAAEVEKALAADIDITIDSEGT